MESVEGQIDSRRKEVDQWMQKCDTAENECLRYSKALGGNIKATGSSVGEMRKEQVLPKRHEKALECQERLRQASGMSLYNVAMKVDIQLTSCTTPNLNN